MRETGIAVMAGIAAAAAFEALNHFAHLLEGAWRNAALGLIFIVASVVALLLSKSGILARSSVGSQNRSNGRMKIDVATSTPPVGDDVQIGSRNRSTGDMSIKVDTKS